MFECTLSRKTTWSRTKQGDSVCVWGGWGGGGEGGEGYIYENVRDIYTFKTELDFWTQLPAYLLLSWKNFFIANRAYTTDSLQHQRIVNAWIMHIHLRTAREV